jgi:methionine synthase I (cobalamin-dependent)
MREPFLNRIDKRALVCDGAMGTMLYAKGISLNRCYDELNLTMPQLVKEVHLAYLKAGAEVIETNTFGANRYRLEKFNLGEKVREFNLAGARLAREAAGADLYVAGAVGPLGIRLEPLGSTSREEALAAFREQVAALVEGGVDLIIVETMMDLNEAHQALRAAREVGQVPVVVQMTVQDDGSTPTGALPEDFARALDAWGADLIGVNCSVGPAAVHEALERIAAVTEKKLSAQPNAGMPRTVEGRNLYLCSPEYMASYATRFIQTGARLGVDYSLTHSCYDPAPDGAACGACVLNDYGGICPVTRCAKRMLNGPCGGSREDRCEARPDLPCAWQLIFKRLKDIGQLDRLEKITMPKDWSSSLSGGSRKIIREDHRI